MNKLLEELQLPWENNQQEINILDKIRRDNKDKVTDALINTYWELWFDLVRDGIVSFKLKGKVVSRYWVGEISYYDNGGKVSVPW